ncbi:MAG: alpha-ribazole phosphatase family protein [Gammaproteobacteria bacterium]|nr:alpha-ribazole phosphatase family protein [Gammaproteobacteria bacterium]
MSDQVPPITTIDLIRHGEPVGGKKYRGQIDDPLSELGWSQMRAAILDHHPWNAIVSSSLSRCHEFAHEVATRHGIPVSHEPRFMEIGFGEWEGRTASELLEEDSQRLYQFWSNPLNNTPPGAETLPDFESRVIAAWNDVINKFSGQHVLLVGHAGMIRMIMRHVLDMPLDRMFRIKVELAGITRIKIEGSGEDCLPQLVFHSGNL